MRYISYSFWIILGFCLIVLSIANREVVTLHILPNEFLNLLPEGAEFMLKLSVPLYLAILFGVFIGLVIGVIWEYLRETHYRIDKRSNKREISQLKREIARLEEKTGEKKDEVLALLE